MYNAAFNQWEQWVHVSVYMLVTHVMSQSVLYTYKKASVPSFTCDNGSWNYWWQPCCFSRKRDGPSSPLIGREVEWHLYYGDAKYTMVQRHNVGALHSLCSSVTLFQGVGEHEETAIPVEDGGVMWESSALLLSLTPADTLSAVQHSFMQQSVLLRLDVVFFPKLENNFLCRSLALFIIQYDLTLENLSSH